MPELKGDLTFRVKADISATKEVFCTDCKTHLLKDVMWSIYAHDDKDDNTTFKGVCFECRKLEIANPKSWKDNKAINQKRWDKKNA